MRRRQPAKGARRTAREVGRKQGRVGSGSQRKGGPHCLSFGILLPCHPPQIFLDNPHVLLNYKGIFLSLTSAIRGAMLTPTDNYTVQSLPVSCSILALNDCVALPGPGPS